MGWSDWSEQTGDPCPTCKGAGVLDTGDKGHGACPDCQGRGEVPAGEEPDAGPWRGPAEDP